MTASRIVNRVPLLRKSRKNGMDRLLADINRWGGLHGWVNAMLTLHGDAFLDHTQQTYGDFAAEWAIAAYLKPFYPQQEARQ